jgi:hypothetical protein
MIISNFGWCSNEEEEASIFDKVTKKNEYGLVSVGCFA